MIKVITSKTDKKQYFVKWQEDDALDRGGENGIRHAWKEIYGDDLDSHIYCKGTTTHNEGVKYEDRGDHELYVLPDGRRVWFTADRNDSIDEPCPIIVPRRGQAFRHFKGGYYSVTCVSRMESNRESEQLYVTYGPTVRIHNENDHTDPVDWTRTLEVWNEWVLRDSHYPPVWVRRFEPLPVHDYTELVEKLKEHKKKHIKVIQNVTEVLRRVAVPNPSQGTLGMSICKIADALDHLANNVEWRRTESI